MNDEKEQGDWEVEEMLKRLPIAGPSTQLDRQMAELFRPKWRMWIGPIGGFLAGAAATAAAFLIVPRGQSHPIVPLEPQPAARVETAAAQPKPALLIEDPQVSTLGEVDVDGHPGRLEYQQPHLILLQKADNGSVVRTDMALPAKAVIRTVLSD